MQLTFYLGQFSQSLCETFPHGTDPEEKATTKSLLFAVIRYLGRNRIIY